MKRMIVGDETVDLVFSFDTTGSMYTVLTQVRRYIEGTSKYLFHEIPNIRIGLIAHGDYCDGARAVETLDLTDDIDEIINFVKHVHSIGGCNRGAMYEQVLKDARGFSWGSGRNKALVLIGDTYPHGGGEKDRPGTCECGGRYWGSRYSNSHQQLDWRNEAKLLNEAGIKIYPVRALAHANRTGWFYNELASISGTPVVQLDQFEDISDLVMAYAMKQADRLTDFEAYLNNRGNVSYGTLEHLSALGGKTYKRTKKDYGGLQPVPRSRFQVLVVDEDTPIKDFVNEHGLTFKTGRGFYEFTKSVTVQPYKEVIVQDKDNGEFFTGDAARKLLGIPVGSGKNEKVRPQYLDKWRGFIQSTSNNRKLLADTRFLYEVED